MEYQTNLFDERLDQCIRHSLRDHLNSQLDAQNCPRLFHDPTGKFSALARRFYLPTYNLIASQLWEDLHATSKKISWSR